MEIVLGLIALIVMAVAIIQIQVRTARMERILTEILRELRKFNDPS